MADTALIFPSLCFWQYCLYISSAIFIVVLPISFMHYIHWRAAITFHTLYPWLQDVFAISKAARPSLYYQDMKDPMQIERGINVTH